MTPQMIPAHCRAAMRVVVAMLFSALILAPSAFAQKARPTPKPRPATPKPFSPFSKPAAATPAPVSPFSKPTDTPAVPIKPAEFKREKASISVPFFVAKPSGNLPAANVRLTATVLPESKDAEGLITFTQNLGLGTRDMLNLVTKYLITKNGTWPAGKRVEISFSEEISTDEVLPGALAVALLVDSLENDWDIDPNVTVFGMIDLEGVIRAAPRALVRSTAAARGGATRLIVPEKNNGQISDMLLNGGPAAFSTMQIFATNNFEDATTLVNAKLSDDLVKAMDHFEDAQKKLMSAGDSAAELLKDSDFTSDLRDVMVRAPNHLTARLLLGYTAGRYAKFSFEGSVETVERVGYVLLPAARSPKANDAASLQKEEVDSEMTKLRGARERFDPAVHPWLDAILHYGEVVQAWQADPPRDTARATQLNNALLSASALVRAEGVKIYNLTQERLRRR